MPVVIPPFTQYQAPLQPLRGLWNAQPKEGDRFANAEIDWSVSTKTAVQFQLSGNSPVAFSQIAGLYIDNSNCGSSVEFLFPDTAFSLTVPANEQALFPVITNALMFYAIALLSQPGDRTVIQILNSMPPPIPLTPSSTQVSAQIAGLSLNAVATVNLVAAGLSGNLRSLSLNGWAGATAAGQQAQLSVFDGTGSNVIYIAFIGAPNGGMLQFEMDPLIGCRFENGLLANIGPTTMNSGRITVNAYYTSP